MGGWERKWKKKIIYMYRLALSLVIAGLSMDAEEGKEVAQQKVEEEDDEPCISFEGPEKVLEIWFVPPAEYEDPVDGDGKGDDGPSSSSSAPSPNARARALASPSKASAEPRDEIAASRRHLRLITQEQWEPMLDLVHCKVIR